MKATHISLFVLASLLASGCHDSKVRTARLQSFKVTLKTAAGTPEAPLPFSATPRDFTIDIEALDTRGERIADYDGVVQVGIVPGEIAGVTPSNPVRLQGGVIENVRISVRRASGPARITVETRGCAGSGDSCLLVANSQAVGASDALHFLNPRIRDIQQPVTSRDTSPLVNTGVTVDRGRNIVAHVSNAGFYVVDRDDTEYNTLFAFNFSRPDGIRRGDRLRSFSGTVLEFLGYTELSFPLWDIDLRCPGATDSARLCGGQPCCDEGQFCVPNASGPGQECRGQECLVCVEGTRSCGDRTCDEDQICQNDACVPRCRDRICAEGSVCEGNRCVPNRSVPDPVSIDAAMTLSGRARDNELEKYEGGFVRLSSLMTTEEFIDCDSPAQNPGANGDGVCEFCRTCGANRDTNGTCPPSGRCCPVGQVCNTPLGECTSTCTADRDAEGNCPIGKNCCTDGPCNLSLGGMLFPEQEGLGICGGCTNAEKAEALCESNCNGRSPPAKLCTNLCDYRDFNQYRAGVVDEEGRWNGKTILLNTRDTLSKFRPDAAENLGRRFSFMKGILSNIFAPTAFWILTPRDECDVGGLTDAERRRTDCAEVK